MKKNGYTLIELSVVLVILGFLLFLILHYAPKQKLIQQYSQPTNAFSLVDNALLGFAFSHGRLPFADSNNDGLEDTNAMRGTIPHKTIGLADKPVNAYGSLLSYALFRKINANVTLDADLAIKKDRLFALLPVSTRAIGLTPLNQSNTIDLCFALRNAAKQTIIDTNLLHVVDSTWKKHVAYLVIDSGKKDADGDGNLLDGKNATAMNFEISIRAQTANYDDTVHSIDFEELFGSLGCGAVISAALHAHDNVVIAADMMTTSFEDLKNILTISKKLASASINLAEAGILINSAKIAATTATEATATAMAAVPGLNGLGGAGLTATAAVLAINIANAIQPIFLRDQISDMYDKLSNAESCYNFGTNCVIGSGNFVNKSNTLKAEILNNAKLADAQGL